MTNPMSLLGRPIIALLLVALSAGVDADTACLDTVFDDGFEPLSNNRYNVGLIVSELGARSATFQLNESETVTFESDGGFCFSGTVQGGEPYLISVTEQPETGLACAAEEPIGIVGGPVRIEIVCNLTRTEWNDFSWDQTHWN